MTPALLAGLTGIVQGARHALEPDHVTAVATVMVETPSPTRGIFYAACWGLGHASMLVFVAGPLVLLRAPLPDRLTLLLEVAVGVMLVGLGARTLRDARKPEAERSQPEPKASVLRRGRRPFAIGIMHGLAGSGALAALIALGSPTVASGLASLALYAFGTVIGMVALATACGPLLAKVGRMPKFATGMMSVAGVASILIGIVWTIRTLAGE